MTYRQKCISKKGKQCQECGSEEDIEVHHIDSNRWNNSIENLVPLCHSCHMKIHSGDDGMAHWIKKIDKQHYNGEPSEEEVDEAFEGIEIGTSDYRTNPEQNE